MTPPHQRPRGLWARAAEVAAHTPASRNRYVDFLRALSILAVISGHWLMVSIYAGPDGMEVGNLLAYRPWTQGITWLFQVMPVFFLVGGYSNAISWAAARRDKRDYASWLAGRLQRLVGPTLPLVIFWAMAGVAARRFGLTGETISLASKLALIPIWFLSVYVGAVLLVPLTHGAWRRWGMASFWLLAGLAALNDLLFFNGLQTVGWANYALIWLAVHQMGYAWREGKISGIRALPWVVGGMALLLLCITVGPYPFSMVSVPGDEVSNTLPPKLPMLLLGLTQIGIVLSLEAPMRRWLDRAKPWTFTVLVNGMIMTIYLWHMTSATLWTGAGVGLDNLGLTALPGSAEWWWLRIPWVALDLAGLALFVALFGRFERGSFQPHPPAWRQVAGALLICGGLAYTALKGIGGQGWLGINSAVVAAPLLGAWLARIR